MGEGNSLGKDSWRLAGGAQGLVLCVVGRQGGGGTSQWGPRRGLELGRCNVQGRKPVAPWACPRANAQSQQRESLPPITPHPEHPPPEPGRRRVKTTQRLEGRGQQPRDAQSPEAGEAGRPLPRSLRKNKALRPGRGPGKRTLDLRPPGPGENSFSCFGVPSVWSLRTAAPGLSRTANAWLPPRSCRGHASSGAGRRADAADSPVCPGALCHCWLRHLPGWI